MRRWPPSQIENFSELGLKGILSRPILVLEAWPGDTPAKQITRGRSLFAAVAAFFVSWSQHATERGQQVNQRFLRFANSSELR